MSFDVNPLNNVPQLRATKAQDGGAGNLGYFQGNKKKKNNEDNDEKSIFKESKDDTFTIEDAENSSYLDVPPLLKITNFFKKLTKKLFN